MDRKLVFEAQKLYTAIRNISVYCNTGASDLEKVTFIKKIANQAHREFENSIFSNFNKLNVKEKIAMTDNVNHPPHYNQGKIEVSEFIKDQKLDFFRGNAVKYICRAGKKDPSKEIEDLEKAKWYISYEIETLKAAKENREPLRPNDLNKPKIPEVQK